MNKVTFIGFLHDIEKPERYMVYKTGSAEFPIRFQFGNCEISTPCSSAITHYMPIIIIIIIIYIMLRSICEIGPNFPICPRGRKANKSKNGQNWQIAEQIVQSAWCRGKMSQHSHSQRGPASWLMDAPHMTLLTDGQMDLGGEGDLKLSPHLSWANQNSKATKSIFQITFKWAARLIIKDAPSYRQL